MPALIRMFMGTSVTLLSSAAALTAIAGPGDGAIVIIDQPDTADVIIQELRADNLDASHVPVKVQITVPNTPDPDASARNDMRSAKLTAYLTKTTDPDGERLTQKTMQLGPEWANRSVVMEVPTPGEGTFYVHVEGDLRFEDGNTAKLISSSTQGVSFDKTLVCKDIEKEALLGANGQPCPVLFETKSTALTGSKNSKFSVQNQKLVDAAAAQIQEMCSSGSLHRVSVQGWASTRPSFDPPNEELARGRADAVVAALREKVPDCAAKIRDDSERGIRVVTNQFDAKYDEPNQCAQIQITSHTCTN